MPEQLPNGRWVSNGRKAALATLDAMLGEERNCQTLRKQLQQEFDDNTIHFFKEIVMPLIPKQMQLEALEDTAETRAQKLRAALIQMNAATAAIEVELERDTPLKSHDDGTL